MNTKCDKCGSTTGCPRDTGWPCTTEQVEAIEKRYYGTADPSRRGYRSFWD
jgi:uncharacterized OB-fold protein